MSWNKNMLVFFRAAWHEDEPHCSCLSIGKLHVYMQPQPYHFYIKPHIEKFKNWLDSVDESLL